MTNKKNRIANELLTLILIIEMMLGFWYLLNFKDVAHAILFFILCVLLILGFKENTNNNPVKQIFHQI